MTALATFTQELTKELDIKPALSPNEEGSYTFQVSSNVSVTITPWNKGYILFTPIGNCPEQSADQFLTRVMLGNMFGQGTGGALLGMSEDGNQLVLQLEVEEMGSYKDFFDHLEDFLNTQDFWAGEIEELAVKEKKA